MTGNLFEASQRLSSQTPEVRFQRRLAQVMSVESGYTCTLRIAGDTQDVSGVRYFAHVSPIPGTLAWVDTDGVDIIVSGAVAGVGTVGPLIPPGAVIPYAAAAAPSGWLLCGGQAVSRTTYAQLFAIIGTTYGAGNGSTTFALPDLRGRVAAGLDNIGGTDAGRLDWNNTLGHNGGAQTHTLTVAEMPSHNHGGSTDDTQPNARYSVADGSSTRIRSGTTTDTTQPLAGATHSHPITAQGGGGAHNNMQPTILLNYIIKH